jgi:hypothetical protein
MSPQKCIEDYTYGEVILKTEEDVENFLKDNETLFLSSRTLKN